jgi:hypothetical protein
MDTQQANSRPDVTPSGLTEDIFKTFANVPAFKGKPAQGQGETGLL